MYANEIFIVFSGKRYISLFPVFLSVSTTSKKLQVYRDLNPFPFRTVLQVTKSLVSHISGQPVLQQSAARRKNVYTDTRPLLSTKQGFVIINVFEALRLRYVLCHMLGVFQETILMVVLFYLFRYFISFLYHVNIRQHRLELSA